MINSTLPKSKSQTIVEYILLGVCLCVLALRTTLTESPTAQSTTMPAILADNIYTLSISAVLIFSFVLWLVWSFCSRKFSYRFTGIEIGLLLFCIAAIIAGLAASNKRTAIISSVVLLAPLFMAVLLVQILDSQAKIKLTLAVIAASAVVLAYQSAEQFFISNQITIEQYEKAPQTMLEPLSIEPDSFQHFLFEHRLYSKDVHGFFTTSNSAGSFALLASFAAIALFLDKLKNRAHHNSKLFFLPTAIVVAIVLFVLIITRSKGAIAGSLFAAALFIAFLCLGKHLQIFKKVLLIACPVLFIAGLFVAAWYGLTHDRLPGGNSMLVRWQYWLASAKMFADHPFAGIGPGNFANFYFRYKPPQAPETITDPHNFLLSILTQYGPLGLVGFLAMIFLPLWKAFPSPQNSYHQPNHSQLTFRTLTIIYLIVISFVLLLIRPIMIPAIPGDSLEVAIYVIFALYIVPVLAFIVGSLLLISNEKTQTKYAIRTTHACPERSQGNARHTTHIIAALFCAVLGVLLHNLTDFAIFEPSVFTTFWAIIACLIAASLQQKSQPYAILKPAPFAKLTVMVTALAIFWACLNYYLIPPAAATTKILQANREVSNGFFERAYNLLVCAADDDKLDPTALNLNGRLYLQQYNDTSKKQPVLLKKAEQCFLEAIARDHANYKNYEKLCTVYDLLGQHQNAYDFGSKAAECYPGSATIQFELAQIAEKLNKTDNAIEHYKNTVDIEDSFRRQFQIMYPNREIVSRIGQEKYNFAKEKIEKLSK